MKAIKIILVISCISYFVGCSKPDETLVEGYVLTEDNIPIAEADVGLIAVSANFTLSTYELVAETKTNQQGFFSFKVNQSVDYITASKKGYFDTLAEKRQVMPFKKNPINIILNQAGKVNFELSNPTGHEEICLFIRWTCDCDFEYSAACFLNSNYVQTSCYLLGDDTTTIEYLYRTSTNEERRMTKDIFCPKGEEINVSLDYNF